ncbi:MAG: gamma carbonic anhydrase family protein [Deltaproteobacteria bacterium]|nr:MAG: gamma carbonic anhydrase family protein [Deltaproteobacteria bacterium]
MILSLGDKEPRISDGVFIAETAVVIGDVTIGEGSSIWFGTVVRGDVNSITIGRNTNIQDNSTLHVTGGAYPLTIGDDVTVGHGAILHGCTVEDGCLIGIGAIVLDGAVVGKGSIVGAGALVTQGTVIPPHSLVMGIPGKVVKNLGEDSVNATRVFRDSYLEIVKMYGEAKRR